MIWNGFLMLCHPTLIPHQWSLSQPLNVRFLSINLPFPIWIDIIAGVCSRLTSRLSYWSSIYQFYYLTLLGLGLDLVLLASSTLGPRFPEFCFNSHLLFSMHLQGLCLVEQKNIGLCPYVTSFNQGRGGIPTFVTQRSNFQVMGGQF